MVTQSKCIKRTVIAVVIVFYDASGGMFVYVFLSTSSDLMKRMSSLELSVHAMDMEGEVFEFGRPSC